MRTKHGDFDDTFAPLPAGCDQQSRWPTRQPMAAEACNETEDDERDFAPAARFWTLYLAAVLVAFAAGFLGWLG